VSWQDLRRLNISLRPFDDPPRSGNTPSPFDAPFGQTLETLARELRMLDGRRIVLQVGYRESDLRVDGMPRANARLLHDAVALSFESKWGPLRYVTNEFVRNPWRRAGGEGWQQNLRAIALAMEALRKVDRYGVSKRGEQYTGWRAIPQTTDPTSGIVTVEDAREFLAQWDGDWKAAARETHPDAGGDTVEFRKVMRAKELIGA